MIEIVIVCVVTVFLKGSFETATVTATAAAWKGVVGVSVPKAISILSGCEWI